MWSSAEIVALDSFAVGDLITWSCREGTHIDVDLPPDVARDTLLIEDSDYALGPDKDFVEVSGRVVTIRVAHDKWQRDDEGCLAATPGTRSWSNAYQTRAAWQVPPGGEASGYLVEVALT